MEQLLGVYRAINAISAVLLTGIGKNTKNRDQGFMFRGIDAVYNALAPALVENHLVIMPRMIERHLQEKVTKHGTQMNYVTVKAEFDFICTDDGSTHTVTTFGEGSDAGDKATNKAMSIAYKYAAFQTFCIPTEDTAQDPDANSPEFMPQQKITMKQISVLSDAITKKGFTVEAACGSFGVNALADIEPRFYEEMLNTVRNEW